TSAEELPPRAGGQPLYLYVALEYDAASATLLASQRQIDRLAGLGTADHRFGPLHVMHARFEGHHGDLLLAANGVGELFLHAVVGLLLRRVGDLRELGIAAATGEDVLLLVHMDGALGAIKPYLRACGQPGGRAHAHVDLGVVGQFIEDIYVVGNADRG